MVAHTREAENGLELGREHLAALKRAQLLEQGPKLDWGKLQPRQRSPRRPNGKP